MAIGREAIVAGYTVLFVPATTLMATLAKAHAEGRLEERLVHFAKPKLLCQPASNIQPPSASNSLPHVWLC